MSELLVILSHTATRDDREAIVKLAPPTQSISDRVWIAQATELPQLRAAKGIAAALTGTEPATALPALSDSETLFAQAWLANRTQKKRRIGEGLDWDTPPMTPP